MTRDDIVFSIVVPVYMVEKYLPRCIESAINQTFRKIEIFLIDDGSRDGCPSICDKYAELDNRITVVHKENEGVSAARNMGMKLSHGKYIVFLDGDDYLEVDACEKLAQYTEKNYDIFVWNDVLGYVPDKFKYVLYSGKDFLSEALKCWFFEVSPWLFVFRRDFLLSNNLFFKNGICHEDAEFSPRVVFLAQTVFCTNIGAYNYTVGRPDSLTSKKDRTKAIEDMYGTCTHLVDYFSSVSDKKFQKLMSNFLVESYLSIYRGRNIVYKIKNIREQKKFVVKYSKRKTKVHAIMFFVSPKLYSFGYMIWCKIMH